ncbi:MAG TPA: hypothetical protein VHA52_09475 [Candidatus Babeliaceae bacterium]|nr:hypothetical protein [Candidatus Babeliaceae bacterium]
MSHSTTSRSSLIHPQKSVRGRPVLPEQITFVSVNSQSSHFKIVKGGFGKIIAPVYGDQEKAIEKIKSGEDRTCEVMLNFANPLGVLVYKNKLQSEYGLSQGLELKTLFLLNPTKNSGNGFGSCLFKRVEVVAQEMGAKLIYCTASSKVDTSIRCAIKNGYEIIQTLEENEDQTLYLLVKEIYE